MSNMQRAVAALAEIKASIVDEVRRAGARGLRNDEIARALGLESSFGGGNRNYLTHSILAAIVEDGFLQRKKRGSRVYYIDIVS